MMEIITWIGLYFAGYFIGKYYTLWKIGKAINDGKLIVPEDEEQEYYDEPKHVLIESLPEGFFAYNNENSSFMAQGKTLEDLIKTVIGDHKDVILLFDTEELQDRAVEILNQQISVFDTAHDSNQEQLDTHPR